MSERTRVARFVRRLMACSIALLALMLLAGRLTRTAFIDIAAHAQEGSGTRLLRNPTVSATQPKDIVAGHDPQLERAVVEAMRMLKEKPADRANKEPPPPTWGMRPRR